MNESYDISTGAYLEEEQNEILKVYFPSGYEPDKNYTKGQMFFHQKWTSHELDNISFSISKAMTRLREFFLLGEVK